jgi:hypothetical protein
VPGERYGRDWSHIGEGSTVRAINDGTRVRGRA